MNRRLLACACSLVVAIAGCASEADDDEASAPSAPTEAVDVLETDTTRTQQQSPLPGGFFAD